MTKNLYYLSRLAVHSSPKVIRQAGKIVDAARIRETHSTVAN